MSEKIILPAATQKVLWALRFELEPSIVNDVEKTIKADFAELKSQAPAWKVIERDSLPEEGLNVWLTLTQKGKSGEVIEGCFMNGEWLDYEGDSIRPPFQVVAWHNTYVPAPYQPKTESE